MTNVLKKITSFGTIVSFWLMILDITLITLPFNAIYLFFLSIFAKIVVETGDKQYKKYLKNKMTKQLNDKTAAIFNANNEVIVNNHISLVGNNTSSFDLLQVLYNKEFICKIKDFKRESSETYNYFKEFVIAYVPYQDSSFETVDDNRVNLEKYLDEINYLNHMIDNTKINDDLYNTIAMIKFIDNIVKQYPNKADKLAKMDYYYLPTLVSILQNYLKLSVTNKMDEDFMEIESKLINTIYLVNQALTTLSNTISDDEIMDLSSDMSVLETMLKKDGLVQEGTLDEFRKG